MILRNVAIRHGRKAFAAPLQKSFRRSLSTEIEASESSIDNHMKETSSTEANVNQLQSTQIFVPPNEITGDNEVVQNYRTLLNTKRRTRKLGSVVSPAPYHPGSLLANPPAAHDLTLELLMASQAHLGHSTSLWNPRNQRYIYGIRQGIHIISLEVTAAHLRRAAKVVEGVAYHGGLILFVGTRRGQESAVVKAAELAKGCHLFDKWKPGTITNGDQILPVGEVKALNEHDMPIEGYEEKLAQWTALKPDLVVCMNPLENYVMLHECGLYNIPTIGVIDTDVDPTWVTYPVPANDDSIRCIQLISAVLGRAGQDGQRKRLEAAETGQITWFPTPNLGRPFTEKDRIIAAAKEKLKQSDKSQTRSDDEDMGQASFLQQLPELGNMDFGELEDEELMDRNL